MDKAKSSLTIEKGGMKMLRGGGAEILCVCSGTLKNWRGQVRFRFLNRLYIRPL